MSRALLWISALLVGMTGCQAPDDASAAPSPTASAPTATAASGTDPAQPTNTRCVKLDDWLAASKGTFQATNSIEDDAWLARLAVTVDGKTFSDSVRLPAEDLSAVTTEETDTPEWTTVCGGHLFVLALPSERDGTVLVGNLTGGKLALTASDYISGEEDGPPTVRLENGRLTVATPAGSIALVEETDPDAETPHGFVADSLACKTEDDAGSTDIRLPVDAEGRITGLHYLSTMPGGNSCSMDADRDDGDTTWSDRGNRTDIVWNDQDYPSHVTITRNGDDITIDASRTSPTPFCGQSAQLADVIKLRRGTASCTSVKCPQ